MNVAASKVFMTATNDLAVLMVFMIIGVIILQVVKPLQKLFLPAGLIGGVVALIVGPQVLGLVKLPATWGGIPTPMINIVLTCAIFGVTINKSKLKNYLGAINLIVLTYFAQMFVGMVVGMGLGKIWKDLPYSWGLMTVYTYWGGHGAATTAGTVFENMGVPNMVSLGIIMATFGLIIAMVAGIPLVNYGVRKGWATNLSVEEGEKEWTILVPKALRKPFGFAAVTSESVNGMVLQLGFILLSMFVGRFLFTSLAQVPVPAFARVMKLIPALLHGIIGAIIVWAVMRKTGTDVYADPASVNTISGVALDLCVCAATATLNLKLFASFLAPLLIHLVCIIVLMLFICVVLLRRWMKHDWFELCLMAFGQGHGSTPSGLALARCVDADHKSTSWEGFGVALGVFTPITSTLAAVMPMAAMQSEMIPTIIGLVVTICCLLFGELVIKKQA